MAGRLRIPLFPDPIACCFRLGEEAAAAGDAETPGEAAAFACPDTPACAPCVPFIIF